MTSIKPGDKFQIETQTSTAICTTKEGQPCGGGGQIQSKFSLLTTEKNDNIIRGNSQGVIQGSDLDGLMDVDGSSSKTVTINLDQFSFEYDINKRLLSLAGNDNEWRIKVVGSVGDFKNDQTQIKLIIHLTKKNGDIIIADMKGLYHPWIE